MNTESIERQLRSYGQDLAGRDQIGQLWSADSKPEEPTDGSMPELGPDGLIDGSHTPYIPNAEADLPTAHRGHRRLWTATAAAIILLIAGITGAVLSRHDAATTADTPEDTAPIGTTPIGPYALPPAAAANARGLVDGDLYAIRYTIDSRDFLLLRYAPGTLPATMTPDDLQRFLSGRGQRVEFPSVGTAYMTCGGGGQLEPQGGGDFDWQTSAVAYWLQDGHQMSLYLIGTPPVVVQFRGDGTAVGPDLTTPVQCPQPAEGEVLEQAVAAIRTVDRTGLDAALDAMPLTIGRYGRAIEQPH